MGACVRETYGLSSPNNPLGIGCLDEHPSGGGNGGRKVPHRQALEFPHLGPRHFRIIQTKVVQIEFDKLQLDDGTKFRRM
jgi:hypothetical protein